MTDQEFDRQLTDLMSENSGKKGKKSRKKWSRKRKIITGAAVLAAVMLAAGKLQSGGSKAGPMVETERLSRGDIQEMLSLNGPVEGTDSAEVVSKLHAEILEILVKEGDQVAAGQVLARLDPADARKEVDIARNAYELALANQEEAQTEAENGYAGARQAVEAASRDYERKAVLFSGGDIPQTELEAAADALAEAKRRLSTYTLENGRPVANKSYALQVKNAGFELEQKTKNLEETEVVSPIAGTVVRVNSRVGRFADMVDDDKPLFVIDNLEELEMKIKVSEYSIGKVQVGQEAEISADILDGVVERGIVTSISPTGEEKGGGSSERVIPITIRIENKKTKLIAGITARAKIVLNEAKDTWIVPISALLEEEDGVYLATVENGLVKLIPVETGVESDVAVEIKGAGLSEAVSYIVTPDASMTDGADVTVIPES